MRRCFIAVLILVFAASFVAGCGQKQEVNSKPLVVKATDSAAENADEADTENIDNEETAPKAVSEPVAMQEAPSPSPAVQTQEAAPKVVEAPVEAPAKPAVESLVLADFNSGEKPNNVGGNFGAWNKDPSDPTQWCKEEFNNVTRHGDTGFSMKLDYSVDSPNPAYNGFWMMLQDIDASKYDTLSFWAKGDAKSGYTTVFKIELKNANKQVGRYYASNLSDQWQEISIPLSEFKALTDRTDLTEFVVVFEDRMASNKKGVIYLDDIRLIKTK